MKQESGAAIAAKLSPPATVIAAEAAGMGLQDWVHTLTIVYLALMIAHHILSKYVFPRLFGKKYGRRATDREPDEHEDAGV